MKKIRVRLKDRSYDILIGHGLILKAGDILKKLSLGHNAIIVTNKAIARLYAKKLQTSLKRSGIDSAVVLVPDSEKAKSGSALLALLNNIGAYDKNRTPFLIALGGGVTGDLTGFAASIYKRGISYVQIPTTLLSQVDSAIGGKTAIDLPAAKNLIGSFCQPRAVISDTNLLTSLSSRQVRNGLAECIKYGIIKDRKLFEYLEKNYKKVLALDKKAVEYIILRSGAIKSGIVEIDEFDKKDKRIILNYGHTVGHAIESACGYSQKYNHGEAVAIGMICAARISAGLGLLKDSDRMRIESLIGRCGLPVKTSGIKIEKIYSALERDKKFIRGKNRFVLPTSIGSVRVVKNVGRRAIIEAIRSCL